MGLFHLTHIWVKVIFCHPLNWGWFSYTEDHPSTHGPSLLHPSGSEVMVSFWSVAGNQSTQLENIQTAQSWNLNPEAFGLSELFANCVISQRDRLYDSICKKGKCGASCDTDDEPPAVSAHCPHFSLHRWLKCSIKKIKNKQTKKKYEWICKILMFKQWTTATGVII